MVKSWLLAVVLSGLAGAAGAQEAEEAEEAPPPHTRMAVNPPKTAAEYEAEVKELRALYAKPPAEWPAPTLEEGVPHVELGPMPKPEHPPDNPHSAAKEELGRMLFFDPRLSGSKQLACASCHEPDLSWADGRTVAFGHSRQRLKRNTPSLLNVGLAKAVFWDGRAGSIEEQAAVVLMEKSEMRGEGPLMTKELAAHAQYRELFAAAFGSEEVTLGRITMALACFERTLVSRRSAFDRFLAGNQRAMSDNAMRGLHLFRTQARCMNCHSGPRLTDDRFHNLGLTYYGRKFEDLGRYQVTGKAEDVGAFKTPSLRNVAKTGPYMHNGFFPMEGVLRLYNVGMPTIKPKPEQEGDPLFPTKDKLLKPLGLNGQDLSDLKAFLESLTEATPRVFPPELPGLPD